MFIVKYT